MGLGPHSLPLTGVLDLTRDWNRGLSLVSFCIHFVIWQPSNLLGRLQGPGPGWLPSCVGLLEKIGVNSIVWSVN